MPVAILQKSTAKIAFAGDIRNKKLFDIFSEASDTELTGILKLKVPLNEYSFYFQKGIIIYATHQRKNMDRMVLDIIKYSGFISRENLLKCEKQKSNAMKTILEMLIDEGFVSMLLYSKVISLAMRRTVIHAMLETHGNYSFEIKSKIDSVHGVKPILISQLKSIDTLVSENRSAVKAVLDSLYSEVYQCEGVAYLKRNQSFLHNAITADSDFLKFFSVAVTDFIDKKWSFPHFFLKDRLLNTIAVYTFRTLVVAGLCAFLYFASMTKTFDLKKDDISGNDFYFIHGKLSESLQNFQESKKSAIPKISPERKGTRVKSLKLKSGQK